MTFFSGTDTSTLQEEGSLKNNFVSLIVNNVGSYAAAITRHVHAEVTSNASYTYEMFGDGPVSGTAEGIEKKEFIEYFMLTVNRPVVNEQNALDLRINEIYDKKRNAIAAAKDTTMWYSYKDKNESLMNSGKWFDDDKELEDKRQLNIPWKEREFNEKPSNVEDGALTITLARLLTSSMTCNAFNIDLDSWIENYDKVYGKKFQSVVDFSEWLSPYLEFVMYHIPGMPTDIIDDAAVAVYADAMLKRLGKPKGKFSKELIDQLEFYGTVTNSVD